MMSWLTSPIVTLSSFHRNGRPEGSETVVVLRRYTPEAQSQPEAENTVYDAAATRTRAEVPNQAIPVHCGEGRVLQLARTHGNTGQDLVPESAGQGEAATGGGN